MPNVHSIKFPLKISIDNFKTVTSKVYRLQGIPWSVQVIKDVVDGEQELQFNLYCDYESNGTAENWCYAAALSFKWLPCNKEREAIEDLTSPFIFDAEETGFGIASSFKWEDLLRTNNGYVKNNTCNLEVKIEMANPSINNKSELHVQPITNTKYRLEVSNIKNLMAVRSDTFMLNDLPCNLIVYKNRASNVGVYLYFRSDLQNEFRITMSATLHSSINHVGIGKIRSNVPRQNTFFLENFVSWCDLFEPGNGFVVNDRIIFDVDIKVETGSLQIRMQNSKF